MLSLRGSIQPDPFSPEHVPHRDNAISSPFPRGETSEVEVQNSGDEQEEEEGEESDEDGFKHLARLTDEAQATQKAKRAREEAERLEEAKNRKRRDSRGSIDGEGPRHGKRAERKRITETTS